VHDRRIELTNRDWCIDPDALARRFAIDHVRVINDFEAAATGIAYLGDDATVTLQPGVPMASAPQVVIGAGSGLGVAYVLQDGRRRHIVSSEGGHASFAPTSLEQAELWRYLFDRKGRVTTEDVVSGPGLLRIHEFLCWRSGTPPPLGALEPATIAESAIAGTELLCARALDLFIECYGAIAGDHALSVCARGGVFLAGGIASRILPRLTGGGLIAAFTAKGPQRALAATIPVRVVTDETLPLIGAASEACRTT
jgi:glucokinase